MARSYAPQYALAQAPASNPATQDEINVINELVLDGGDGNPNTTLGIQSHCCELGATGDVFEADPATELLNAWRYDGEAFAKIGNAFDTTTLLDAQVDQVDISDHVFKVNADTVALCNHSSDKFSFFSWDGTDFTYLGTATFPDVSGNSMSWYLEDNVIAIFTGGSASPSEVAIYDIDLDLMTMTKRGNGWTAFGGTDVGVYALSSDRIAVVEYTTGPVAAELFTLDHDGTDFAQVGNKLALTVAMTNTYKGGVWDPNTIFLWQNGVVEAYSFDGADWAKEGDGVDTGFGGVSSTLRPRNIIKLTNSLIACRSRLGTGQIKAVAIS